MIVLSALLSPDAYVRLQPNGTTLRLKRLVHIATLQRHAYARTRQHQQHARCLRVRQGRGNAVPLGVAPWFVKLASEVSTPFCRYVILLRCVSIADTTNILAVLAYYGFTVTDDVKPESH